MTVCLVCDNRDTLNWGCRATSMALSRVLSNDDDVTSFISRHDVTKRVGGLPRRRHRASAGGTLTSVVEHRFLPGVRKYVERTRGGATVPLLRMGLEALTALDVTTDFVDAGPQSGAQAVLDRSRHDPFFRTIVDGLAAADDVVINGEGSVIMTEIPRRDMLFQLTMVCLAVRLGKRVHFTNAMVSDDASGNRGHRAAEHVAEVLPLCDSVLLRDPISVGILAEVAPSVGAHYVPDALFTWVDHLQHGRSHEIPLALARGGLDGALEAALTSDRPYVAVSGGSLAVLDARRAIASYTDLVRRLQRIGVPVLLIETCGRDRFLRAVAAATRTDVLPVQVGILEGAAVLGGASLLVSGRYHPSIMATIAGVPTIGLHANSHKIESLGQVLAAADDRPRFSATPDGDEIERIVEQAQHLLDEDESASVWRRTRCRQLADDVVSGFREHVT